MPTDIRSLLHRDHVDLQAELTQLLDPIATAPQLQSALDGVRLGLMAHAEAEDIVLGRFDTIPQLAVQVAQARAAHQAQETALGALVRARVGSSAWRDRALYLRELVRYHAAQEEDVLLPALRAYSPRDLYDGLAGAFATERLRQLAMLQPSVRLYIPEAMLTEARAS